MTDYRNRIDSEQLTTEKMYGAIERKDIREKANVVINEIATGTRESAIQATAGLLYAIIEPSMSRLGSYQLKGYGTSKAQDARELSLLKLMCFNTEALKGMSPEKWKELANVQLNFGNGKFVFADYVWSESQFRGLQKSVKASSDQVSEMSVAELFKQIIPFEKVAYASLLLVMPYFKENLERMSLSNHKLSYTKVREIFKESLKWWGGDEIKPEGVTSEHFFNENEGVNGRQVKVRATESYGASALRSFFVDMGIGKDVLAKVWLNGKEVAN